MRVRAKKKFWSDDEKVEICRQASLPEVSVAQVARRYGVNSNLIFKWLRDGRYTANEAASSPPLFLPVEVTSPDDTKEASPEPKPELTPKQMSSRVEITLACGHRIVMDGAFDGAEVARLIRGLTD